MSANLHLTHTGRTRYSADDPQVYPHELTLECPEGLPADTRVRVVLGGFRTIARRMGTPWELVEVGVTGQGRTVMEQEPFTEFYSMQRSRLEPHPPHRFCFMALRVAEALGSGARLICRLQGRVGGFGNAPLRGLMQMEVRLPDMEDYQRVGQTVVLECLPARPARVEVRVKPMPDEAGEVSATIFQTDDLFNPTLSPSGKVRLEALGDVQGLPATLDWRHADGGRLRVAGLRVSGTEAARIRVLDKATGSEVVSQAILPGPLDVYRHYFGALHFHTHFSGDGDRDLRQALDYARNLLNLDVIAPADHTPARCWPEILAALEEYNQPGQLVTLPAWESSRKEGHYNVYLRSAHTPLSPLPGTHAWDDTTGNDPAGWNEPQDVIVVPHATNVKGHPALDWSRMGRRTRLVEMLQVRGCSEANEVDARWRIQPRGGTDSSVRAALGLGLRLGFIAGTDNHEGFPTRGSYPTTPQEGMEYIGMTGLLARELTREAIWEAMNERHTYATSGVPILCHFTVNGAILGSEIQAEHDQPVRFRARLYGTAPIERVEIISEGGCVRGYDLHAWDVDLEDELPAPRPGGSYYYLRLLQEDGHRAWASPVWVDPV